MISGEYNLKGAIVRGSSAIALGSISLNRLSIKILSQPRTPYPILCFYRYSNDLVIE